MKIKVTKKSIMETYPYVIKIGYCNAYNLLKGHTARMYTAGVYGWNSDIYIMDEDTVVVTGYRPFGNISVDYNWLTEQEAQASKLWQENRNKPYEWQAAEQNRFLDEFVKNALKRGRK